MTVPVTPQALQTAAARIADEVLFPAALDTDRADRVPASHLDLLAAQGFYGVAAPPEVGGLGAADLAVAGDLVRTLASGCLTTTFLWIQHHGCVREAAGSRRPGVRERWLLPLARGQIRGGVALAGLRGGPERTRVRATEGGFVVDGTTPWVSGWDMIDVMQLGAVDDAGMVHFLLVDAVADPTVHITPMDLVAARASRTVTVRFTGHEVAADRLTRTVAYDEWQRDQASGSALNGFLALGVADRCIRLLGPASDELVAQLAACHTALLSADATVIPAARAAASELALRAAATLAVHTGSRSLLRSEQAQRLLREAAFLLVFGSRPAIRTALLASLTMRP